jgi:hypothetical protein
MQAADLGIRTMKQARTNNPDSTSHSPYRRLLVWDTIYSSLAGLKGRAGAEMTSNSLFSAVFDFQIQSYDRLFLVGGLQTAQRP